MYNMCHLTGIPFSGGHSPRAGCRLRGQCNLAVRERESNELAVCFGIIHGARPYNNNATGLYLLIL